MRPQAHIRDERGFTLVELMVVLLVAALLLCAGVPGFQNFLASRRLVQASNAFFHSAHLTRVLAVRQGGRASMQPMVGNNWASGWQVRDGDIIVMQQDALPPDITITNGGGGERISFSASGRPQSLGTWRLRSQDQGLQWHVVINMSGRIRQCRLPPGRAADGNC